jgi:aspartyl-tRNA(Asn)/glutamyl-tRNA(Gln) amidotransferase subunit A
MKALTTLTLAEAQKCLIDRSVTSEELVSAAIARAKLVNPEINAFLRLDEELALARARALDLERAGGAVRGPLHGIPLAHKDMFHRAGRRSTYGAKADVALPTQTSTALSRLDAAGAVEIGALNMTAFAVGPTGHNRNTGNCRNPWNTDRITGGSSSGSGAAVAARAVFGALGSDTAGSVRLPAALCGVTGLKPTYGRISRAGTMGFSFTLDVVGPIARTAEDCAILMDALAGPDDRDPTTIQSRSDNYLKHLRKPVRGLRVGVPDLSTLGKLDGDVQGSLEQSLAALADLGCELIPVQLPDLAKLDAAAGIVLACEGATQHAQLMREQPGSYGMQLRTRLERGFAIPAPRYIDALRYRSEALRSFSAAVFANVDVLHLPVAGICTPLIDKSDVESGSNIDEIVTQLTRFTRPINYLGLPAIALPVGFDANAMPLSMQLVGRPLSEDLLLRMAHAYQAETRWHLQMPPDPAGRETLAA